MNPSESQARYCKPAWLLGSTGLFSILAIGAFNYFQGLNGVIIMFSVVVDLFLILIVILAGIFLWIKYARMQRMRTGLAVFCLACLIGGALFEVAYVIKGARTAWCYGALCALKRAGKANDWTTAAEKLVRLHSLDNKPLLVSASETPDIANKVFPDPPTYVKVWENVAGAKGVTFIWRIGFASWGLTVTVQGSQDPVMADDETGVDIQWSDGLVAWFGT
jgi:hypothetical protein